MSKISVIIPIYNAAQFLEESVRSAFNLPEVLEILLIEDGSKDHSKNIAEQLCKDFLGKIILLSHPNGANLGAGASRNLGIQHAKGDYIAFLDADDYYLPNRFKKGLKILEENPEIDFVISPSMIDTTGEYKFVEEKINNSQHFLFPAILTGKYGYFDTNSILIKRTSLTNKNLTFNTQLKLHQDSELWLRITYLLKGYAENTTWPGSIVRRHANNRITHKNHQSLALYWTIVYEYFKTEQLRQPLFKFISLRKKYYTALNRRSILTKWYLIKIKIYDPLLIRFIIP